MTTDDGEITIKDFTDPGGEDEIKDFSFSLRPKRFRIDPDVFLAIPEIPLGMADDLAKLKDITADEGAKEKILDLFDLLLFDASAARMRERADSKVAPMPLRLMMPVINWLLEVYGLRPQGPSEDSSTTSADGGSTPSTAGVPLEVSSGPAYDSPDS